MAKKRKKPKMEFRYYQMSAGSPILALLGQKWRQNYGKGVDYLHFHNYLEIGFCYEGEGHLILGEDMVRFHGREFTVLPPNYPHTTNSDPGDLSQWEYLFIDVEGFLRKFLDNPVKAEKMLQRIYSKPLFLKEADNTSVASKILKIMDIMRNGEEFYLEEAKGILASLLAEIARMNRNEAEERVPEEKGKITNMISRSLDYISDHYMEDIKIENLAKSCHISETHLRRIFQESMRMPPVEYINWVRIRAACKELRKTNASVSDIALHCGFTTISTFNRNFRKILGVSPQQWRRAPEHYEQNLLKFDIKTQEGW